MPASRYLMFVRWQPDAGSALLQELADACGDACAAPLYGSSTGRDCTTGTLPPGEWASAVEAGSLWFASSETGDLREPLANWQRAR